MAIVNLSPVFNLPNIQDLDGNPASGFLIYSYEAGSSSVLKTTYTNGAGDVENSNPIVLDSSGNLPDAIWLLNNESYHLVLTNSSGTTVIKGFDDVVGVPGIVGGGQANNPIWVSAEGATYLTPSQFQVAGNMVVEFGVGNRVRLGQAGGYIYGTVSAVGFTNPNTNVTLLTDTSPINSSLATADYSILNAAPGATVDAGGVSYFDALAYTTPNTVGWKIKQLSSSTGSNLAATEAKRAAMQAVWTATGGPTSYALTPNPPATSYTVDQIYMVKFIQPASGNTTMNISGLGAKGLKIFAATGEKINAFIPGGLVSQVAYDGVDLVVLDPPLPSLAAIPKGEQIFTAPGTFTVPPGVYSIKVTLVAGGGGGGVGWFYWPDGAQYLVQPGSDGGNGGLAIKIIPVSPGQAYAVVLGAPGLGGASFTPPNYGNGTAGGSTSFGGTVVVASGGAGGPGAGIVPSAPGYAVTADYGLSGVALQVGQTSYGKGGRGGQTENAPGANGGAGMVVVEW